MINEKGVRIGPKTGTEALCETSTQAVYGKDTQVVYVRTYTRKQHIRELNQST